MIKLFLLVVVGCFSVSASAQTVLLSWAIVGCSSEPNALTVQPSAGPSAVDYVFNAPIGFPSPMILVLSTSATPQLLGHFTNGPCLLLPAPEVLLAMTPGQFVTLPVPFGTPPVTVWAQGVLLEGATLTTSNGYVLVVS